MPLGYRPPLLWLSAGGVSPPPPPPPPPPPVGLFHYKAHNDTGNVELFHYEPLDIGPGGGLLFSYNATDVTPPTPGTLLFAYIAHDGAGVDPDAPIFTYTAL